MLSLTDFRQDKEWDCGGTVVRVLFDYWSKPLPSALSKLSTPVSGMPPDVVENVFRSQGFQVFSGNVPLDVLKSILKTNRPCLTLIQSDGDGHWVTCRGVTKVNVHFHDPLCGFRSLPIPEWQQVWVDRHYLGTSYDQWIICPWLGELL